LFFNKTGAFFIDFKQTLAVLFSICIIALFWYAENKVINAYQGLLPKGFLYIVMSDFEWRL
jgi:hypothetical protein